MQKAYARINWENEPSINSPINETNLNKMDYALDLIDNRVIRHEETKADKIMISDVFVNVTFDYDTGIFTFYKKDGSIITIDTLLEKIAINFDYDSATQRLIITLEDGTVKYIDLSTLITQYEFLDSETIAFSLGSNGKVKAIVKEGSIEEKHLRPDYLADIKIESSKAETAATNAEASAENAKGSEENARNTADTVLNYARRAETAANTATEQASSASESAQNAATSESNAVNSEKKAQEYANSALSSSDNASIAEIQARNSANSAKSSEEAAAAHADNAAKSAAESERSAENSKTYMEKSKEYSEQAKEVIDIDYASKETAGIAKFQDIYADGTNGNVITMIQTADAELTNSYPGGLRIESVAGESVQESTAGVQLLPLTGQTLVKNGLTLSVKGSSITIKGTPTDTTSTHTRFTLGNISLRAGMYTMHTDNKVNGVGVSFANAEALNLAMSDSFSARTNELTSDYENERVYVNVNNKMGTLNYSGNWMLNAGETTLPYESYTGGTPSPSSSYPQEIKPVRGRNELDCRGLTKQTINGVTFTPVYDVNGNLLYVNVNGTATAQASLMIGRFEVVDNSNYILSGCPSGGTSKYKQVLNALGLNDLGVGVTFNASAISGVSIVIESGYTANNLRFYPMIRSAAIADSTYVPYGLLRFKATGKNRLNNIAISKTVNGGTFTVNTDKSVTVNGTFTAETYFRIANGIQLSKGKYIATGCPEGGSLSTYRIVYYRLPSSAHADVGNGYSFELNEVVSDAYAEIVFNSGYTANNLTFYPMIRSAAIADSTRYETYREKIVELSSPVTLHGVGDVKDKIVRKDGEWCIERNVYEFTLDGTQSVAGFSHAGSPSYGISTYDSIISAMSDNSEIVGMCERFRFANPNTVWFGSQDDCFSGNIDAAASGRLRLYSSKFASAEDVKNYFTDNPTKFLWRRAEPVYEELPVSDKVALNSLVTFDTVTYVSTDSEIEPVINKIYGTSKVGADLLDVQNELHNSKAQSNIKMYSSIRQLLGYSIKDSDITLSKVISAMPINSILRCPLSIEYANFGLPESMQGGLYVMEIMTTDMFITVHLTDMDMGDFYVRAGGGSWHRIVGTEV